MSQYKTDKVSFYRLRGHKKVRFRNRTLYYTVLKYSDLIFEFFVGNGLISCPCQHRNRDKPHDQHDGNLKRQ